MTKWILLSLCLLPNILNYILSHVRPGVTPAKIADAITGIASGIAIAAVIVGFDWFPIWAIENPVPFAVIIVALAALPVIAGLLEGRLRTGGEQIYSTQRSHWLLDHLKNNLSAACAGISIVYFLHSIQHELIPYIKSISWSDYLEPILAFAALAAVWFCAVQQRTERSQLAATSTGSASTELKRSTLKNPNQILNTLWITVIIAFCVRGGIYILSFLYYMNSKQTPLEFNPSTIIAMAGALIFFFSCGANPDKPEIYITFIAGTPIAILAQFVWISMYHPSPELAIARWVYPVACLLLYALILGLTFHKVKGGKIGLFSMAPVGFCIVAFAVIATLWQ